MTTKAELQTILRKIMVEHDVDYEEAARMRQREINRKSYEKKLLNTETSRAERLAKFAEVAKEKGWEWDGEAIRLRTTNYELNFEKGKWVARHGVKFKTVYPDQS